jgi:hypothetical protein
MGALFTVLLVAGFIIKYWWLRVLALFVVVAADVVRCAYRDHVQTHVPPPEGRWVGSLGNPTAGQDAG